MTSKIAVFDAPAGVAGDMWVAALLDAGVLLADLQAAVDGLALPGGVQLRTEQVQRGGLRGLRFLVDAPAETHATARHLSDIRALLAAVPVPATVRERAEAVFTALARAEAHVHDCDFESVHFHEVGAVDAICDVLCACLALERLGIERVVCSAVELGSGVVKCEHGILPIPPPGALANLIGVPTVQRGLPGERTTPTGAALLRVLVDEFEPARLQLRTEAVGYGAGLRDDGSVPNLLRVRIGTAERQPVAGDSAAGGLVELACNLDTATGEQLGWLIDRSLELGALDAWSVAAQMKKGRPGVVLHALVDASHRVEVERLWLEDGSTLGLRAHAVDRAVVERWSEQRETELGTVRFKVARLPSGTVTARPEDDDVRRLCTEHRLARHEVLARLR